MEKTWNIVFDPAKYNTLKEFTIHGVRVKGSLSPYDIPRRAIVGYDEASKVYRIHFDYLTPDEPTDLEQTTPEIALYLGEKSGKLYDIIIRTDDPNPLQTVMLTLIAKIDDLAQKSARSTRPNYLKELNLLVAKKFLEENQELYSIAS